jgi:hypothetical protein
LISSIRITSAQGDLDYSAFTPLHHIEGKNVVA